MNNPINFINTFKNPQEFMDNMMKNSQIMQNPIAKNTFDMMQKGDSEGLEKLARNLCKEKGIDPDEVMKQLKQQFGL